MTANNKTERRSELPEIAIERRARELAAAAEKAYVEMMKSEVQAGALAANVIQWWEPRTSTSMKKILDRVRRELELAHAVAGVLFP